VSNVQVSVWVALAVALGSAIIGAGGPIAAQFVNAWRERRREEIRWARERNAESVKLHHEYVTRWRDSKIRIYGEYLKGLRDLEETLSQMRIAKSSEYARLCGLYENQFSKLGEKASEIQLICSIEMLDFLRSRAEEINSLDRQIPALPKTKLESSDNSKDTDAIVERKEYAKRYRREFLAVAREELGVRAPELNS
jgi:hypothetical protein